ncbi:MAG: class I SAM-dependent methyltransferase [Balneolaceae bacterium]
MLDLFFLRSWHIRRLLRRAGKRLDEQGEWAVLDAGCGFGQYDRFILAQFENARLVSVDIKTAYIDACRNYFEAEIATGSARFGIEDLVEMEKENQFDLILCVDVLEHIEDDLTVIRNLVHALKPGGQLLMHSPSHFSEADSGGDEESFVGEHARTGYSKKDISEKYRKAGLSIDRVHYTYGPVGHLSWVISVKYPLILLSRIGMAGLLLLVVYYPIVLPGCLLMNLADLYTANRKGHGIYALGTHLPGQTGAKNGS